MFFYMHIYVLAVLINVYTVYVCVCMFTCMYVLMLAFKCACLPAIMCVCK